MLLDSAGSPRSYGAPDVDDVLGFALGAKVGRRLSRLGLLVEPSVSEGICPPSALRAAGTTNPSC